MLLLDNFVHSDLHPGNIMVKFTKPSNSALEILKNLWTSSFTKDTIMLPPNTNASDCDDIVTRLEALS